MHLSIPIRSLVWRGMWAVLAGAHAPALVSTLAGSIAGEGALPSFVLLALAQVLFLLKVLDVSWLRIPVNRRSIVALSAGFVLLHADVISRTVAREQLAGEPVQVALAVGGVSMLAALASLQRRDIRIRGVICEHLAVYRVTVASRTVAALLPWRFLLLQRAHSINRAPPARA